MSRAHANIVAGEGDESDSDDEDWLDDVDVAELTAEDIRAAGLESPFVTPHVTPKAEASNTTFGGNAVPAEVDAGTGVGTRAVPGDDAGTGGKDTGAMHPHPSSSQNGPRGFATTSRSRTPPRNGNWRRASPLGRRRCT